jgi:hypothetical protein
MAHKAEIIEIQDLSDGALAVRARCCDDPLTDSVHTVYNLHAKEDLEIEREMADHAMNVEQKHQALIRKKAVIEKFKQKQKDKAALMPKKPTE